MQGRNLSPPPPQCPLVTAGPPHRDLTPGHVSPPTPASLSTQHLRRGVSLPVTHLRLDCLAGNWRAGRRAAVFQVLKWLNGGRRVHVTPTLLHVPAPGIPPFCSHCDTLISISEPVVSGLAPYPWRRRPGNSGDRTVSACAAEAPRLEG